MEYHENATAAKGTGVCAIRERLDRHKSKEHFGEYALERIRFYRAAAEALWAKKPVYSPAVRPGPITRLPPELLRIILKDWCAEPTVARVARVCREWHQIAIPLLYSSVDLGEGVELEMWAVNASSEYRWQRGGRGKLDAQIAPMSSSVRLLHTLSTTPYVRYVRKLSYRGIPPSSKSSLEPWRNSSIRTYYGRDGSVDNRALLRLRIKTVNLMIAQAKKVSRLLIHLENLELRGKTDFRIFDAFLGVLKWRPLRQLTLHDINVRACHFDRRPSNYSITSLRLHNVAYYFDKEKRRGLGAAKSSKLSKIRGTEKIYSLLRKCPELKSLCITDCDFNMEYLLECRAFKNPEKSVINFPKLAHLHVYSSMDPPTWDYDFRNRAHWFLLRHPDIRSLSCNAGLLAKLLHGASSFRENPEFAIMPQNLRRLEIDQPFMGTQTDYNLDPQEGHMNMKRSLPQVLSMMPLLEELQFKNFPWSRNYLRICLQALQNSRRLKILRILELFWEVTLPILRDLAKLSPHLISIALECVGIRVFDEDRDDDYERFDIATLAQTLSPLYNLRELSLNYSIEPITPAIFAALSPFPIDPRLRYLFRVFETLRDSNPKAFEDVRNEYVVVVSDAVAIFSKHFVRMDYLNFAVWESAQFLDGNELSLLRIDEGCDTRRRCIGWKQSVRGVGKLDVRLDVTNGKVEACNFVGRW